MKRVFRQSYVPPKLDSQTGQAKAMLMLRPKLDGIAASSLAAQWNLRIATAEYLIEIERSRRERLGQS